MLQDLPRDLVTLLRYVAPPLAGLTLIWALDVDHDVIAALRAAASQEQSVQGLWPLALLLAAVGVTTFTLHRAVFIYYMGRRIHSKLVSARNGRPSLDELDFSRYRRRVASVDTADRGTQVVLDQANAAVDFFYCCAWNALAFLFVCRLVAWPQLELTSWRWLIFATTAVGFFAIGRWSHRETSRRDLAAYDRFDGLRKNLLLAMLESEKHSWRNLETLQHVIGSDTATTKQLLLEVGARASEDGKNLWGLLKYHPLPTPKPEPASTDATR